MLFFFFLPPFSPFSSCCCSALGRERARRASSTRSIRRLSSTKPPPPPAAASPPRPHSPGFRSSRRLRWRGISPVHTRQPGPTHTTHAERDTHAGSTPIRALREGDRPQGWNRGSSRAQLDPSDSSILYAIDLSGVCEDLQCRYSSVALEDASTCAKTARLLQSSCGCKNGDLPRQARDTRLKMVFKQAAELVVRTRSMRRLFSPAKNATLFWSFPYACPEPVLVK